MGLEFRPSLAMASAVGTLARPAAHSAGGWAEVADPDDAAAAVTALYYEHALGLMRFARLLLGSPAGAEDVVQDAFCGLYRRWDHLDDKGKALGYVRSAVLNGCRSLQRRSRLADRLVTYQPDAISAETAALIGEERREVVRALRRLPRRQREVLVLRYYMDLSDEQIASDMGISQATVRSARRRALHSLEQLLAAGS
jgi:RNA polymerase sigma-70 factor (sigma-E family)